MDFNNYAQKGNEILDEVAIELGFPGDRKLSGRMLRSVLHVLRERLTIEESFQMLAQLPLALKGVYVEGWKIGHKPKRIKNIKDFVREVVHEDYPAGHHDISTAKDGQNAIMAVLKVLKNHISKGEYEDILSVMPEKLHVLWGEEKIDV